MKIVAFVGPKGSGKDTCADILKKSKKLRVSVPFALPLKRICCQVFGLHYNLVNDPVLKEKELRDPIKVNIKHLRAIKNLMQTYVDPYGEDTFYNLNKATDRLVGTTLTTPRQILQIIGTEFIRNEIHPDWHCMAAFSEKNLTEVVKSGNRNITVAVTDCRFPNEFNYILKKFGHDAAFFYVERPEAEERLAKATHASETSVIQVKELIEAVDGEVINNAGTLDELEEVLKSIKVPESTGKPTKVGDVPGSRFRWGTR
jgi:hypothetical protein